MEKAKTGLKTWVKVHRKQLILVGSTILLMGGGIIIFKNRDAIKEFLRKNGLSIPDLDKIEPIAEEIVAPVISRDILDNLTGNRLTARTLGDKVWCSAQAINKRIVDAGLAVKLPCGEYMMTEAGRLLGKDTWKITAAGHSFSNIEWDEKILEMIFTPEELQTIAKKQEIARQILIA